jgi:hypothetical protein
MNTVTKDHTGKPGGQIKGARVKLFFVGAMAATSCGRSD